MSYEIKNDILNQQKEFPCASERLKTIVDPYDYCNLIANNIDSNVNMFTILITDPYLFYMILFDSWNHHIYRLNDKDTEKQKIAIENIKTTHNKKISVKLRWFTYNNFFLYYLFWLILIILIIMNIYYFRYTKITKFMKSLGLFKIRRC